MEKSEERQRKSIETLKARLTNIQTVKRMRKQGLSFVTIAEQLNLHESTVRNYAKGK